MLYFCWCTAVALQGLYPHLPASLQLLGETLVKTATNRLLPWQAEPWGSSKAAPQRKPEHPHPGAETSRATALSLSLGTRQPCGAGARPPFLGLTGPSRGQILSLSLPLGKEGKKKPWKETSNSCFLFSLLNKYHGKPHLLPPDSFSDSTPSYLHSLSRKAFSLPARPPPPPSRLSFFHSSAGGGGGNKPTLFRGSRWVLFQTSKERQLLNSTSLSYPSLYGTRDVFPWVLNYRNSSSTILVVYQQVLGSTSLSNTGKIQFPGTFKVAGQMVQSIPAFLPRVQFSLPEE